MFETILTSANRISAEVQGSSLMPVGSTNAEGVMTRHFRAAQTGQDWEVELQAAAIRPDGGTPYFETIGTYTQDDDPIEIIAISRNVLYRVNWVSGSVRVILQG